MRSMSASVDVPYISGSREPNRLRLGPLRICTGLATRYHLVMPDVQNQGRHALAVTKIWIKCKPNHMFENMAGETKSGEEAHKAMKITVNGEDRYFDTPLSVAGLLTSLALQG